MKSFPSSFQDLNEYQGKFIFFMTFIPVILSAKLKKLLIISTNILNAIIILKFLTESIFHAYHGVTKIFDETLQDSSLLNIRPRNETTYTKT